MTTKNIKFNAEQDKLQTRYAMLTFLQWFTPFLMFVFSGFLLFSISEPFKKHYREYRTNLYHSHAEYAKSEIHTFQNAIIKFEVLKYCGVVKYLDGIHLNLRITRIEQKNLGIPTSCKDVDVIFVDKLQVEYFRGEYHLLHWQGKGMAGQSINIHKQPLSNETKAEIFINHRPIWFFICMIFMHPISGCVAYSLIINLLIQQYKKRLKRQIENHSPNFFD